MVTHGDFRTALKLADQSVDLVLTDPPYGNLFKHTRQKFKGFVVTGDDLDWLPALFVKAKQWLKPGAPLICFNDYKGFSKFEAAGMLAGFNLVNVAIWDKRNFGIGYNFRPQHEFLMLFSTSKSVKANTHSLSSILPCPRVAKKEHPTQKPVPLLRRLVEEFSQPGDLVVDPFCGSGSTALACQDAGRRFRGSELLLEYKQLADARIKGNLTRLASRA